MKSKNLMTFIKILRVIYLVLRLSAWGLRKLMKAINNNISRGGNNYD